MSKDKLIEHLEKRLDGVEFDTLELQRKIRHIEMACDSAIDHLHHPHVKTLVEMIRQIIRK